MKNNFEQPINESKQEEINSPEEGKEEELLRIPGVGPKTLENLKSEGISSVEELKERAENDTLKEIKGFGEIRTKSILENIGQVEEIEEVKEKYNSQEIREFLTKYKDKQKDLVELEYEIKKNPSEELVEKHKNVAKEYEVLKAEYIGSKTWRALSEKKQRAEQEREQYLERSKFEKIRKGWRWLGDQNLEKIIGERKTKTGRFLARFISLRTAVTGSLFGVGYLGVGALGAAAALGARKAIGSVGATYTAYELMSRAREVAPTVKEEEIPNLSDEELGEKITQFEATAKFAGKDFLMDKNYNKLRREQKKRLEGDKNADEISKELYKFVSEQQENAEKRNKKIRNTAIGLGGLSFALFNLSSIAEKIESVKEGWGEEKIQEIINEIPEGSPKEEVVDNFKETLIENNVSEEVVESMEKELIGTVEPGGNFWQAAKGLVESGKISEEEFTRAWSNSESTLELLNGDKVHISELGLTYAGDELMYIPGENGEAGKFEVITSCMSTRYSKLLDVFEDTQVEEAPQWIKDEIETRSVVAERLNIDPPKIRRFDLIQLADKEVIEMGIEEACVGRSWECVEASIDELNEKVGEDGSLDEINKQYEENIETTTEVDKSEEISAPKEITAEKENFPIGEAYNTASEIVSGETISISNSNLNADIEFAYANQDGELIPVEIKKLSNFEAKGIDPKEYIVNDQILNTSMAKDKTTEMLTFSSNVEMFKALRSDGYEKEADFLKVMILDKADKIENINKFIKIDRAKLEGVFQGYEF